MTTTTTPVLSREELATILAALRYYQSMGLGDPLSRPDDIHWIATDNDQLTSLAAEDIDRLCEHLNSELPMGGPIDNAQLYLRSFDGRLIRVEALFPVADPNGFANEPANDYMQTHDGASLLAICNRVALIAAKDDHGVTEASLAKLPLPAAPAVEVDMPIAPQHVATNMQPAVTLTVPLTPQFVGDVLCTMIESGYPWFEWRDDTRENDAEDVIGWRYTSARAVEIDEDDQTEEGEGQSRIIDGAVIAEAMGKILKGGLCNSTMMTYIAQAVAEQDGGHVDMDVADCIAQVAVFGELRYG